MRIYNGHGLTGVDMYLLVAGHKMTRVFFRGETGLVTKLMERLETKNVTVTEPDKDGWRSVDIASVAEEDQISVTTLIRLDDFKGLQIATNEN